MKPLDVIILWSILFTLTPRPFSLKETFEMAYATCLHKTLRFHAKLFFALLLTGHLNEKYE